MWSTCYKNYAPWKLDSSNNQNRHIRKIKKCCLQQQLNKIKKDKDYLLW